MQRSARPRATGITRWMRQVHYRKKNLMYRITAVHTEPGHGGPHDHIAKVKLSDGTVETRAQVIHYIRNLKMTYVTSAPGVPEAKVIVASCPECGSGDYITTEPDNTEQNNLLDLPRFY